MNRHHKKKRPAMDQQSIFDLATDLGIEARWEGPILRMTASKDDSRLEELIRRSGIEFHTETELATLEGSDPRMAGILRWAQSQKAYRARSAPR